MYAVVEIKGLQFKVEPGMKLWVPYMGDKEVGEEVEFTDVLLVADGDDIKVGQPTVEGASVKAKILEHAKDAKIIVFRKRRRKGFHKKKGHRQRYSIIQVEDIRLT